MVDPHATPPVSQRQLTSEAQRAVRGVENDAMITAIAKRIVASEKKPAGSVRALEMFPNRRHAGTTIRALSHSRSGRRDAAAHAASR